MLTQLQLKNFKSWRETDNIRLAPLTGLFGTNSSGKTSLLQFLLLLKQTAASPDRSHVLHLGDKRAYVDLGLFEDMVYGHQIPGTILFDLKWSLPKRLNITDPERKSQTLFRIENLAFQASIRGSHQEILVERFQYLFGQYVFGMKGESDQGFELTAKNFELKRNPGRLWPLPSPGKHYIFPDQVNAYYQNVGFLSEFVLAYEELWQNLFYLGPLREFPGRYYAWSGQRPQDVGQRGERAIEALLASERDGPSISQGRGRGKRSLTVTEKVAEWLRELGLIHDFALTPIAANRKEYEVKVRHTANAPEVLLTDVGFGVSQILPVLVLCYYVPQGSTILLEQPELHLHPSVQSGLADVFIDVIQNRKVQIVLESHSEHLLRRLQRRIAEEKLQAKQTALYFTNMVEDRSQLTELQLDLFGNISNWPDNFFGDEMGDLVAMTEAVMQRQNGGMTG
jgi:predicted ATPase